MGLLDRLGGPKGTVRGSVGVGGRGAGGHVVRLLPEDGRGRTSVTIGPDSTFSMRVPAGAYRVQVLWQGLRFPEETAFEAGSIRIEGGETREVALDVPAGSLAGRMRREAGGPGAPETTVRLEVTGSEGPSGWATRVTGFDGTFAVRPCPVGKARAIVGGEVRAEVSVAAGGAAKLEGSIAAPAATSASSATE